MTDMTREWSGWTLAGVPIETRQELMRKGIDHRLVGLLGASEAQATKTIHQLLGVNVNGEVVASVLRAWKLGSHVVALEVQANVWTENLSRGDNVGSSHAARVQLHDDRIVKRARTSSMDCRAPRGRNQTSIECANRSLHEKEADERNGQAEELMTWARAIPHARCWAMVAD